MRGLYLLLALIPLTIAASSPTQILCGSRGLPPCPDSRQTCVADPSKLGCSLVGDCPGLCVILDGQTCGGFLGLTCPSGWVLLRWIVEQCCKPCIIRRHTQNFETVDYIDHFWFTSQTCVDDPRDDCDPQKGGADCSGICVFLDGRSAAGTSAWRIAMVWGFPSNQCSKGNGCVRRPES